MRAKRSPAGRAADGVVRTIASGWEGGIAARRRQVAANARPALGPNAAAQGPTPVTVADAALLLWPHRRRLTAEERRIVADILAEGRCASASADARLIGAYDRLRSWGMIP